MRTLWTFPIIAALAVVLLGASSAVTTSASPARDEVSAPMSAPGTRERISNDADQNARQANEVLGELTARYRHLDGVTVSVGPVPNGHEAVAYYTSGRIVISRSHTVDIEKILAHEVWHVIDWRDNGRLDWGESLPPGNASSYSSR